MFVFLSYAALASCGGGSSSAGGSNTSTTTTSTPAVTPYSSYAQLAGDQSFKTGCAAFREDYSPPALVATVPFGSGLTLGYTAATQTYVVTPDSKNTGVFGTQPRSYGPADKDTTATASIGSYARTTNGFRERLTLGMNTAAGSPPDYARGFSLRVPLFGATTANASGGQYACVLGVPTRTDDLPTTNIQYSRAGLNGSLTNIVPFAAPEVYSVAPSQVSISIDPAGNRLSATVHLIGALVTASGTSATTVDFGTFTGTAAIDRTGAYTGVLSSSNRSVQDSAFTGWFFGPQAGEAAFSVSLDAVDQSAGRRIIFIGTVIASK